MRMYLRIATITFWATFSVGVSAEPSNMSARAASYRASQGRLLLIDVRTPKEWQRTGIPLNAVPISMKQPLENFLQQVNRAAKGDKRRPIALICASGTRSSDMVVALEMDGYLNVRHIEEGMDGSGAGAGWISAGLPVRHPLIRRD
jgi:rhodanese-related sulfurtransferase